MPDKQTILAALIEHEIEELRVAEAARDQFRETAELSSDQINDTSLLSQSSENLELSNTYEESVVKAQAAVDLARSLSSEPSDTVSLGAIVEVGDSRYIVSVAAEEFQVDGATYTGISEQAPLYLAMAGSKAGDTFSFNGQDHTVDAIH